MATCASHRFLILPFGFLVFGSFGPATKELLDRVYPGSAIFMPVSLNGRLMHASIAASLSRSCLEWLAGLLVVDLILSVGDISFVLGMMHWPLLLLFLFHE